MDILAEFLEVAFHTILYVREIYPKSVFELKKKYDAPIYVSIMFFEAICIIFALYFLIIVHISLLSCGLARVKCKAVGTHYSLPRN